MSSDGKMYVTVSWEKPPFMYNQLKHYSYKYTYQDGRDVSDTTVFVYFN